MALSLNSFVRARSGRGTPSVAFRGDFVNVGQRSYDVASDGRLLVIDGGEGTTTRLHVVTGFFEELRAKVGN